MSNRFFSLFFFSFRFRRTNSLALKYCAQKYDITSLLCVCVCLRYFFHLANYGGWTKSKCRAFSVSHYWMIFTIDCVPQRHCAKTKCSSGLFATWILFLSFSAFGRLVHFWCHFRYHARILFFHSSDDFDNSRDDICTHRNLCVMKML